MSHFNLFVYAPVVPGGLERLPRGRKLIGRGVLRGTLYRLDGAGPVLMLYGDSPVCGEIWRCPAESLAELDAAAGVAEGRLRRVARSVPMENGGEAPGCWLYVAGPALAHELLPERRVREA